MVTKPVLIMLIVTIIIFATGWTMPEPYEVKEGESHLFGLKFMPPCRPFGTDVTCGYDMVFLYPFTIAWLLAIIYETSKWR